MRILAVGFAVYAAVVIAASALGVYVLLPLTTDLRTVATAPVSQRVAPPPAEDEAAPPLAVDAPVDVAAASLDDAAETREPETEWSPATKLGLTMDLIVADRPLETDTVPTQLALLPPVPIAAPAETPPAAAAPSPDVTILLQRGETLLATGDVAAARLFFGRAAERGDAAGAIGLAKTYDPLFLAQAGFRTTRGNAAQAAAWYRRARDAGHPDAAARLDRLLAAAQPKS